MCNRETNNNNKRCVYEIKDEINNPKNFWSYILNYVLGELTNLNK